MPVCVKRDWALAGTEGSTAADGLESSTVEPEAAAVEAEAPAEEAGMEGAGGTATRAGRFSPQPATRSAIAARARAWGNAADFDSSPTFL